MVNLPARPDFINFETIALKMMNRTRVRSNLTMDRRFRQLFGTTPQICAKIWEMLNPYKTFEERGARPKHLLWCLLLLKLYAPEATLCSLVGGVDEKTFRKWSFIFMDAISCLDNEVVSV